MSEEGRRLARRVRIQGTVSNLLTNVVGAVTVFAFAAWVLPAAPGADGTRIILTNLVLLAIWLPLVGIGATVRAEHMLRPARQWLVEGRPPTHDEGEAVLLAPQRLFRLQVRLWVITAVVFSVANGLMDPLLIPRVAFTTVLGGLSTSAITYLTTERLFRPMAARALAEGCGDRPRLPGVTARQLFAWALGSGVPLVGLVITGIFSLAQGDSTPVSLAVTMVALGGTALVIGSWTALLGARAVADPVESVREGLAEVEEGNLEIGIPVYDGSDLGRLQDGFNRMVEGLRERERIRTIFGRHVGEDIAHDAVEHETGLGGVQRDVAVLFVDIIGSTRLAARCAPTEVVEVLNRFFKVVVDTIAEHGGWVNKFEGDAALAVWGAPRAHRDPAGAALAAARDLAARLDAEVTDCKAGIGVAAGPAVAGNVGAVDRFEYTVIGDPVNAASRLTELAKDVPGRVLASGEAVAAAGAAEADHWDPGDTVVLRGRTAPTEVFVPGGGTVRRDSR